MTSWKFEIADFVVLCCVEVGKKVEGRGRRGGFK